MDSSPDLSLKLRRGSSDSRDTFYMDFAQGIDSDIEEVDNSNLTRAPQQPPTPPLPVIAPEDALLGSLPAVLPPPPVMSMQPQPLPTLNESDDLPPTPPPVSGAVGGVMASPPPSPPASPTSSILEMIPPPPLSPHYAAAPVRMALPPSPPIETEDEGDDGDVDDEGEEEDDDDEYKASAPPPLPPLPSNLSYVHGNGAHGTGMSVTPPMTKSPSTSPSPPDTPPACSKMMSKLASPPMHHQPQTPPSESDQSQPGTPPSLVPHDECPASPPPDFAAANDVVAAALAAAVETTSLELMQGVLQGNAYQLGEENRSLNEDESTTITTPPSNGYSASSIIAPPAEHLGELEEDVGLILDDIPPPAGMEDDPDEEEDEVAVEEEEEGEEASGEKTPVSEPQPADEQSAADTQPSVEENDVPEEAPATPPSQATPTPTASGSPKRSSMAGSRGPSRSASRSGSHSGSHSGSRTGSRSGSVRGSHASRAGSIAAASVASAAASVASAAGSIASGSQPIVAASPQASVKSLRSQPSIKSAHSVHSVHSSHSKHSASPPILKSPPEGDRPPVMPSPPMMRSPPAAVKSPPPMMHSPPRVTSPPRVYSPPLISSPPMRKAQEDEQAEPIKGTPVDSSTTPSSAGATSSETIAASAAAVSAAAASTTFNYQDEHVIRPHLSSHHHYHLPHQFQHPHHQNHHTHAHGSMPVPTPTVPVSFSTAHMLHEVRHVRTASTGGGSDDDGGPPPERRSSPPATATAQPASLLLATETGSHASVSPAKSSARLRDSTSQHRVTIDESNLPISASQLDSTGGSGDGDSGPPSPGSSSQRRLASACDDRQTGHLALMYHSHQLTSYPVLPAIKRTHRPSFVYPPMPRIKAGDALATLFSALYGKLLVVMGIAFPMAEVISTYIPPSFYEVYYLYLYIGSMIFLLFMYATLLWGRPKIPVNIASPTKASKQRSTSATSDSMDESDTESSSNKRIPLPAARRPSLLSPLGRQHHYGSFYLRMGAVAFGIGSMIYSGLEFGQYFELNPDTKCHNVLLALTPATRMAFIFIQMYFIFLNNEQIKVYRYKIIARFGLMHMIGTNLAVWLNVLIQETKHEILTFYNPENRTLRISHRIPMHSRGHAAAAAAAIAVTPDPTAHIRIPRGLKGPYQIFECRRTNIIGTLVQDASPFLFPCTIEYSLICAAILYVMWRSISRPHTNPPQRPDTITSPMKRSPHHYSVDCARAHKGLFVGILILVLTIISLILFFVLISRPDFVAFAVTEVTICELFIYGTATIATLLGMFQIRHLQYDAYRSFSLDDILLVGAQTGSFLYNIFTVIAGHFTLRSDDMLVPINALASIVQTACQTMFILDASRRQAVSPDHIRKKPGREIVTFMLVVNLAMWAISTLEKSRAESHPIQLNFYGLWAWTIITHVSMPLAIFYRFHSTVCLCEIWKRAYKLKPTYM